MTTDWLESILGRALTDEEQRCVIWINGWNKDMVETIAGLIDQAHRFGYISGDLDKEEEAREHAREHGGYIDVWEANNVD